MKKLILLLLLSVVLCGCEGKYPNPEKLSRSNGTIHHPTYGDYSEMVEFKQGMTIMPGQTATIEIEIPILTDGELK